MLKDSFHFQFPVLSGRVHGEESPVFCNAVGETVKVHVQDTEHQTALLLQKVKLTSQHYNKKFMNNCNRKFTPKFIYLAVNLPGLNIMVYNLHIHIIQHLPFIFL